MIAIVCAMENELSFYKTKLENCITHNISNNEFLVGTIGKNKVVLSKCGIGKVNSAVITSIIINNFKPKLVINTGIAGGKSPLNTNDIFIANSYVYGDFDLQVFGYKRGQVPGFDQLFKPSLKHVELFQNHLNKLDVGYKEGMIVTQDSFITSNKQIDSFEGMIATDMEGASICHTCNIFNTNFLSIRIISDIIEGNNQINNYNEFEDEAAKLSGKITYKFLRDNLL